jgi:hypothetical protein
MGNRFLVPSISGANSSAVVATSQTTSSDSYTDLATVGPTVTLSTGNRALVIVTCRLTNGTTQGWAYMSYAVSGATTTSASDATAVFVQMTNSSAGFSSTFRMSAASVATLNAGSNTFTAKYRRASTGTATFVDREIFVINLA